MANDHLTSSPEGVELTQSNETADSKEIQKIQHQVMIDRYILNLTEAREKDRHDYNNRMLIPMADEGPDIDHVRRIDKLFRAKKEFEVQGSLLDFPGWTIEDIEYVLSKFAPKGFIE